MPEGPIIAVIAHESHLAEEPGFRNAGVLRIDDEELRITTTWWNWARHMAWPLGLLTTDLGVVFAGPARSQEVVITMRHDKIDSIVMLPDAKPLPRVQVTGTREEDSKRWLCSFAYRQDEAPLAEQLRSFVPSEQVTLESA